MFLRLPLVVDHLLATEVAYAEAPKIAPPIPVPVSTSMSVRSGPETSLVVSTQ